MHKHLVGCCGWTEAQARYVVDFPVIEIQTTFYYPPAISVARRWRATAPAQFIFCMKAWQLITHTPASPTYRRLRSPIAESEADMVGAKLMYEAGYNPQDMVRFFQRLEEEGGAGGSQFFSDHPNPGNRAAAVAQETSQLPPHHTISNTRAFNDIKQIAAGMKPYTAQQIARMSQRSQQQR